MNISRRGYLGDIFTIFVLILATGAAQSAVVDVSNAKAVTEGNTVLQLMWAAIYVIVAARAVQQFRAIVEAVRSNKLLIALVLLTIVSAFWSDDAGLTLRRSLALVATTLFAVDFAVRYSIRGQLRLVAIALGSVVVASIVMQLFFPGLIPTVDHAYPDAWVGLFGQKNEFGRIIVLATMVSIAGLRRSIGGVILAVTAVLAGLGLIIATQSMTSVVAFAGMLLVLQFAPTLRWNAGIRAAAGILGVAIAVPVLYFVSRNRQALTQLLGRSSSLTGRAQLWKLCLASIALKPILGYGYSAFWNVSDEATRISATLRWAVPHAHNAYIEIALDLGLVGLALYAIVFILALRRAITYMRMDLDPAAKWPLIYLCFVLLYSFTESAVLVPSSIFWMLFVAAACTAAQPVGAFALASEDEIERGTEPEPGPSFATS